MYRVGLTGGIASGKSTVADLFSDLGVPVIDTDVLAREVVVPGSAALAEIAAAFGAEMVRADGSLDRRRLREFVFSRPEARRRLEGLLHPLIRAAMEIRSAAAGGPYQMLVIPLLFESGLQDRVERVLVVDCPEDVQRARLMARDGETPESVERLLAAQWSRADRLAGADDVIDNGGDLPALKRQVRALHYRYFALAAKHG